MTRSGNRLDLPLPGRREHVSRRISECVISFGSNLGARRELISAAARRISTSDLILSSDSFQTSRLFETPPIGGPGGQEPFLNAVAIFQTEASAKAVLAFLQNLEQELGRTRRLRWDARSIDLDVVLHGQLVGGAEGLVVPHPRYTARQFVLQPACDIASHYRDPRFGWSLGELTQHLTRCVPSLALVSGPTSIRQDLCRRLSDEFAIRVFSVDPSQSQGPSVSSSTAESERRYDEPWVSDDFPDIPNGPFSPRSSFPDVTASADPSVPRLLVRLQRAEDDQPWPPPHQIWPSGWRWPEYRLEIGDLDWAVQELASAIQSMRCEVEPVTENGAWY